MGRCEFQANSGVEGFNQVVVVVSSDDCAMLLARIIPTVCLAHDSANAVRSIASDEHPVVARPWPGGEKRRGGLAPPHEECEAIGSFLLPCVATGVSLLAV